jgi:hypothetical protein
MISSAESTTRWGLLLCGALVEFQLPGRLLQLLGRRAPTPGASIPAPIASSPAPRVTYNSQGAYNIYFLQLRSFTIPSRDGYDSPLTSNGTRREAAGEKEIDIKTQEGKELSAIDRTFENEVDTRYSG